jgi:hypothetical protein
MAVDLRSLISSIPGWQQKTASQVYEDLNAPHVHVVDSRMWTWSGIAEVLGDASTEALRNALENGGSKWAVYALTGTGLPLARQDIQEKLYALHAYGIVPNADKLALEVNRMESVLQNHKITASLEDVDAALESLKLELLRQAKDDEWQDRLQAARERLVLWDGDPAKEPKL